MARSEARIKVAIWQDDDWTALPIDAQWLYMTLLSQSTLSHAGLIPIPRRMWSNLAIDDDAAARIARARKELEERGFIVVDDDTDELLIRSYIRNDVADGPPGTFRSAMAAARGAISPRLRAVLHAELLRLDVEMVKAKKANGGEPPFEAYRRAVAALAPAPKGPNGRPLEPDEPEQKAVDNHAMPHAIPHAMGHALGVGVGVGEGELPSEELTLRETRERANVKQPLRVVPGQPPRKTARKTTHAAAVQSPILTVAAAPAICADCQALPPERRSSCGRCMGLRRAWERDRATAALAETDRRTRFRTAVDACPRCDENGKRETDTGALTDCECSAHLRGPTTATA